MATRLPALIQLSDPRLAAQLVYDNAPRSSCYSISKRVERAITPTYRVVLIRPTVCPSDHCHMISCTVADIISDETCDKDHGQYRCKCVTINFIRDGWERRM